MAYPHKQSEINEEFENLVQIGIKGSFEKQQKLFNKDENSKKLYKKALELASY